MRRVFLRADGGVSVMHFTQEGETLMERDTQAWLVENPGGRLMGEESDTAPIPNRRFRNSWTHDGIGITVDLVKARAQRLGEIRIERDAALAATDGMLLRDQEQGKDVTALLARRQALRDLPARVEADLARLRSADAIAAYSSGL